MWTWAFLVLQCVAGWGLSWGSETKVTEIGGMNIQYLETKENDTVDL